MKKLFLEINDEEKLRIKNLHEQIAGGGGKLASPGHAMNGYNEKIRQIKLKLTGSFFENGIDTINVNSSQYINAINTIKSKNLKRVIVVGGASAVGSPSYNNEKLAKRRASNFIAAAKNELPDVDFVPDWVVGVADVKDSPEAKAEQFVGLIYDDKQSLGSPVLATDNTTVRLSEVPSAVVSGNKGSSEKKYRLCLTDSREKILEYVEILRKNGVYINI